MNNNISPGNNEIPGRASVNVPYPLSIPGFRELLDRDAVVLDARTADSFSMGFIPGSIYIGRDERSAGWACRFASIHQPVLLVAEPGEEAHISALLTRAGFSQISGFLDGGIEVWTAAGGPLDMLISVEPDELAMDMPFDPNLLTLDVRTISEYAAGHIRGALHIPLSDFTDPAMIAGLDEERNLYLYSGEEYRSFIACSLLKRQGIHHLRVVAGGWNKIRDEQRIPLEKDDAVLN